MDRRLLGLVLALAMGVTLGIGGCGGGGAGGGGGGEPALGITPSSLDFASVVRYRPLSIANTGSGTLTWTITDDMDWLTVDPPSGTGGRTVMVKVDRSEVSEGAHSGTVTVNSNAGSATVEVTMSVPPAGTHGLTNLFFLHHSTGDGLIGQDTVPGGIMRSVITDYNTAHATSFAFWDHCYNDPGLRNPDGTYPDPPVSYNIPNDNTDPEGLWYLWTSSETDAVTARSAILDNHQVIAFKSCFPASAIGDAATLEQYKTWYLQMRNFFDTRTDRLFVVMSTPPLHRLATNETEAWNARMFANWLSSAEYLPGHPNVVCFNLFDYLAKADDGSATANMLRYEYEGSHSDSDSHPNTLANETVGPIFAQFLIDAALAY